jgi:ribonuclease D
LREIQLDQLKAKSATRSAEALSVKPSAAIRQFDPNDFWRIKGSKDLEPQQQAILRELFIIRDKIARVINRSPLKS